MPIAVGIAKSLRFKAETTPGVAAGTTGGFQLRRVSSDLDLSKENYQSNEILTSQQIRDFRHGFRRVEGTIAGELSPGTYSLLMAALLRKDFAAGGSATGLTTVAASASAPHFVRSAGSWITDGFKIGDIISSTGWSTTGVANNGKYFRITALTATDMTVANLANSDAADVAAKTEGDTINIAVVGKKTMVPLTGHVERSFTFEHWFSDIAQSELFVGCRPTQMGLQLPPTGIAQVSMGILGTAMTTDTSAYFTSPAAQTSTGVTAAVNGVLRIGGTDVGVVTGLNVGFNANRSVQPVVGSNVSPDVFRGKVLATGGFTAFFQDATYRDAFLNETELSIQTVLTTGSAANADFVAVTMNRIKLGSARKNDVEQGLQLSCDFTALEYVGGSNVLDASTVVIQDSQAA